MWYRMTKLENGSTKKKEKFDIHAEALKFLQQDEERKSIMIRIKSETPKRAGTRIIVELSDGTELEFFYVESGSFKGWNET